MWLIFLWKKKKKKGFFPHWLSSKILALSGKWITISFICRCTVLASTAGCEKLKVKQWGSTEGENMPCSSWFLFQHLSAGSLSKLVWAKREGLRNMPKISAPRQMIESRGECIIMSLTASPCPKADLFISGSASSVAFLCNLFLKPTLAIPSHP